MNKPCIYLPPKEKVNKIKKSSSENKHDLVPNKYGFKVDIPTQGTTKYDHISPVSVQSPSSAKELNSMLYPDDYNIDTSDLAQSLNDLLTSQLSQSSARDVTFMSVSPMRYNDFQSLYTDPNTPIPTNFSKSSTNGSPYSISSLLCKNNDHLEHSTYITTPRSSIPNMKLSSFSLPPIHMEYLKLFYTKFSRVIMPLCALNAKDPNLIKNFTSTPISTIFSSDESKKFYQAKTSVFNPARDFILYYAKKESYVLAAVLACGALSAYKNSQLANDQAKYCGYLSTCMSLLGKSLNEQTASNNTRPTDKMEGMIITILLLTSYNASSNVVQWRPHLETAGKLLSYHKHETNGINDGNNIVKQETLAFCRAWFYSIEIVAAFSSNWGGTMNDNNWDIMETWITDDIYLLRRSGIDWYKTKDQIEGKEEMNSSYRNDFNILSGYSIRLALILGRLSRVLKHVKMGNHVTLTEISWFLSQLESKEVKEFEILSHSGYLDKNYQFNIKLGVPLESIEKFDDIDQGDTLYLSWWDLCYQSHRMSAIIHILTKLLMLDKNHYLVMNAIEETAKLFQFLKTRKKVESYEIMMIQVCVSLLGEWTTKDEHKSLVSKYYSDLHDFGNVAASYSMKKLEKIWRNEYRDDQEEDIISY